MITLTENAKNYLSGIAKDDYITLGVNGGGCSGFQYVWDYKKNWPNVKWSKPYEDCLVLDPMAEMFIDCSHLLCYDPGTVETSRSFVSSSSNGVSVSSSAI